MASKPSIAILLGKPSMGHGKDSDAGDKPASTGKRVAVRELMAAIKDGDEAAATEALDSFVGMCGDDDGADD